MGQYFLYNVVISNDNCVKTRQCVEVGKAKAICKKRKRNRNQTPGVTKAISQRRGWCRCYIRRLRTNPYLGSRKGWTLSRFYPQVLSIKVSRHFIFLLLLKV